jgi:hypothetical protein
MKLVLKNNVDKKEYEFSVTDLEDSGMFWHFNLSLVSGMCDGEYSYVLPCSSSFFDFDEPSD